MVNRRTASLVLSMLALVACADGPRCGKLYSCDIREVGCQQTALRYAVCLRDRDESQELAVALSTAQREPFVAARIAEQQAADTPLERTRRRALAMLSLSPADSTLESEVRINYQNTAAVYQSDPPRVTVIDDGRALTGGYVTLLVHEMVHALQDAAGELTHRSTQFDGQLAESAIIEGEAALFQDEAWAAGLDISFDDMPYGKALRSYRAQQQVSWYYRPRDAFSELYRRFTYPWGASYLWPLRRDQGAAAIAQVHATRPVSTAAVIARDTTMPTQLPNDLGAQAVPVLPDLTLALTMHLGLFAYDAAIKISRDTEFLPDSAHYLADTLSVFSNADNQLLTVWRIRYDDPAVVSSAISQLPTNNPTLRFASEGSDLWLIKADTQAQLESLPPLTWQPAPSADPGYAPTPAPRSQTCFHHNQ